MNYYEMDYRMCYTNIGDNYEKTILGITPQKTNGVRSV